MSTEEVERVVSQAIRRKLVLEVDYIRQEDGVRTSHRMEPFDVAAGRRSRSDELRFWGWCRFHNRIEQKIIPNIISIRVTDEHFDPKIREKTFSSRPIYRLPREW